MQLTNTSQLQNVTTDKPFMIPVEDVFSITGRGTVATGRVERGKFALVTKLKLLVSMKKLKKLLLLVLKCSVKHLLNV